MGAPVVKDEQLHPSQLVDDTGKAAVETRQGEIFEQTRHAQVEHGMIEPGGLTSEGAGQQVFPVPVCPVMMRFSCAFSQAPWASDSALGRSSPRCAAKSMFSMQASTKRSLATARRLVRRLSTHGGFTIEHQAKPFVAAEIVGVDPVGQVPIGGGHSTKAESLHLVEGWMCQHGWFPSFIDNRSRRGCWCVMAWA